MMEGSLAAEPAVTAHRLRWITDDHPPGFEETIGRIRYRPCALRARVSLSGLPVEPALAQQKPATVAPDHAAKMAEGLELFKDRVRPLLIAQCLECHGGKAKKGDFDLSDRKPLHRKRHDRRRRQGEPALCADHSRRRAAHAFEEAEAFGR